MKGKVVEINWKSDNDENNVRECVMTYEESQK